MLLNVACVLQILVVAQDWVEHFSTALFVVAPIVICVSALPTPRAASVRENSYVLMLAVPEINSRDAGAIAIALAYAGSLFWSLIGACLCSLKERHHLAEVTHADAGSDG